MLITEELNLVDVWRTRNPITRDCTFYSHSHNSWSRIDMCWVSGVLLKKVEEIEILPSTFEDHNPIVLKLGEQKKRKTQRLNTDHLKDEKMVRQMKKEMKDFFLNSVGSK